MNNHCFTENQNSQPETNNDEESTNRNIRVMLKKNHVNREIRSYYPKQPHTIDLIWRGDMTCRSQTANHKLKNGHSLRVV